MKDSKRPSSTGGEYTVGYGRPPQHTRFQPSRSGNPKGRRKGSKNLSTLFAEELAQTVTLTENGKRKKVSKRQALVKQAINKALGNDPKAAALVSIEARHDAAATRAAIAALGGGALSRGTIELYKPSTSTIIKAFTARDPATLRTGNR